MSPMSRAEKYARERRRRQEYDAEVARISAEADVRAALSAFLRAVTGMYSPEPVPRGFGAVQAREERHRRGEGDGFIVNERRKR